MFIKLIEQVIRNDEQFKMDYSNKVHVDLNINQLAIEDKGDLFNTNKIELRSDLKNKTISPKVYDNKFKQLKLGNINFLNSNSINKIDLKV